MRRRGRSAEAELQAVVLDYLRLAGVFHWRASAGQRGRRGVCGFAYPPGTADVLACVNGRFVGIEVKGALGKLRASQEAWKAALEAAGGLYWVVRDLDELRQLLRGIGFPAP